MRRGVLWPESLGLRLAGLAELRGRATAGESAELVEGIVRGREKGAGREIVLLNAGAALVVAGLAPTLTEGLDRATEAVDSGAAAEVLGRLRNFQARASVMRFRERHLRPPR
jgi:anthranilate phosphoribosyltransferase